MIMKNLIGAQKSPDAIGSSSSMAHSRTRRGANLGAGMGAELATKRAREQKDAILIAG